MRKFAATIAVIGVLLAAAATATGAAEPYGTAGLTLNTSTPTSPGTLIVTVDDCQPNSTMTASFDTDARANVVATGTADANGVAVATISVPSGLRVGDVHTVTASYSNANGEEVSVSTTVTIAGSSSDTTIAGTDPGGPSGSGTGSTGSGSTGTGSTGSGETLAETGTDLAMPLTIAGLALVLAGGGFWLVSRRRSHQV